MKKLTALLLTLSLLLSAFAFASDAPQAAFDPDAFVQNFNYCLSQYSEDSDGDANAFVEKYAQTGIMISPVEGTELTWTGADSLGNSIVLRGAGDNGSFTEITEAWYNLPGFIMDKPVVDKDMFACLMTFLTAILDVDADTLTFNGRIKLFSVTTMEEADELMNALIFPFIMVMDYEDQTFDFSRSGQWHEGYREYPAGDGAESFYTRYGEIVLYQDDATYVVFCIEDKVPHFVIGKGDYTAPVLVEKAG